MDLHTSKQKLRGIGEATALFLDPARAEALATLASLEGSPGPAAALARPVGGLLLIDAYALVGLAVKYASGGGGAGDAGLIFTRWVEAMAGQESLTPG